MAINTTPLAVAASKIVDCGASTLLKAANTAPIPIKTSISARDGMKGI